MPARKRAKSTGKAHRFGGDWTSTKLEVLAGYLRNYTLALKDKPSKERPFRKAYVDAFAGTGCRSMRVEEDDLLPGATLFPDLAAGPSQDLLDGSARLALKTDPPFDSYIFIEKSAARCAELENLRNEFPRLATNIRIERSEANERIQELCSRNWRLRRAVLFLDPYGMQVEWKTIKAIADTKAIDMWLLFPLGIGVNRLLTRTGDIPRSWRKRLDALLGTTDWYDEFYRVESERTLFGTHEDRIVKATTETIGRYFTERLKTIFAGVVEEPGVLRNSSNSPLYLLCFAAGNAKGAPTALRIANHLLKEVR